MEAEAKAIAVHQTQRQKYLQLVYRRQAELYAPAASTIRMLLGIFVFSQAPEQPLGVAWSLIRQAVNPSFLAPKLYALNSGQVIATHLKHFCRAQRSFQTALLIEADLKSAKLRLAQQQAKSSPMSTMFIFRHNQIFNRPGARLVRLR